MTVADRRIQDRVAQLQRADVPIRVSRLIGVGAQQDIAVTSASDDLPLR